MTLQVLVVDDEYFVLKGLEIMLSEQTQVPLSIKTASDAFEALQVLENFLPDVIVADISMPEMDGFALFEKVQEKLPDCKLIICSGYDDQDYLKKALKLHVSDYLTKPINGNDLIHQLEIIHNEKEGRITHALMCVHLSLINGNSVSGDLTEKEFKLLFPYPYMCFCTAYLSDTKGETIRKNLLQYFPIVHVLHRPHKQVFLINCPKMIQIKETILMFHSIFEDSLFGVSSMSACRYDEFLTSFPKFLQQTYLRILKNAILEITPESYEQENMRSLLPALQMITFEITIDQYLKDLFKEVRQEDCFPILFSEICAAYLSISDIVVSKEKLRQIYEANVSSCNGASAFEHFIKNLLRFLYEFVQPKEQKIYSSKIDNACHYINDHFRDDISLDDLANQFGMNPSYLSYVFRKETGITFLQYLTNVRIEKSCSLLLERPEISLEDLSEQVGYHSASYFHKIFRSRFGMSPRSWSAMQKGES